MALTETDMTISTLDPLTPPDTASAGGGNEQLQQIKAAIQNSFLGFSNATDDICNSTGPEIDKVVPLGVDGAVIQTFNGGAADTGNNYAPRADDYDIQQINDTPAVYTAPTAADRNFIATVDYDYLKGLQTNNADPANFLDTSDSIDKLADVATADAGSRYRERLVYSNGTWVDSRTELNYGEYRESSSNRVLYLSRYGNGNRLRIETVDNDGSLNQAAGYSTDYATIVADEPEGFYILGNSERCLCNIHLSSRGDQADNGGRSLVLAICRNAPDNLNLDTNAGAIMATAGNSNNGGELGVSMSACFSVSPGDKVTIHAPVITGSPTFKSLHVTVELRETGG
jgi:hypothetical protein